MKTFRMIGIALMTVLMCVNFAACSSDDDPTEEPEEEGGIVVSEKKLAKIAGKSEDGTEFEEYTFIYDSKGRLVEGKEVIEHTEGWGGINQNTYIWGDNAIRVTNDYILSLNNGLIQNGGSQDFYTYNKSNRLIIYETSGEATTAIWDNDKLVSISDVDGWDITVTYEKSCKKGYFPFVVTMMDLDDFLLFMAHPEIVGMRTSQLPANIIETSRRHVITTYTYTYEFDKEGYISKMIKKGSDGSLWTYTLTWK